MSVGEWWARRQWVTGLDVPYPIGSFRDAWAVFPRLVEQYHADRNHDLLLSQIPPAAEVWLLWVCGIGHDFVATPAEQRARPTRSRRSWCPVCATPSALPPARKWPPGIPRPSASAPRLHNSGVGAVAEALTGSSRRVGHHSVARSPELWRPISTVVPGEAFVSAAASGATSAAEGRLRALLAARLDVDLSPNAVRVRQRFFGKLEVWPDLVLPELRVAIELDTVGRAGDEHVGERERSDRRKDKLLADVGWAVIRVRCAPLRALGPLDLVVPGVSARAADELVDRIGQLRGDLLVAAYRTPRER